MTQTCNSTTSRQQTCRPATACRANHTAVPRGGPAYTNENKNKTTDTRTNTHDTTGTTNSHGAPGSLQSEAVQGAWRRFPLLPAVSKRCPWSPARCVAAVATQLRVYGLRGLRLLSLSRSRLTLRSRRGGGLHDHAAR